ncbi:MAG: ferrous iron transporter B [Alphaproteobacteria bacterium]|nr:ferrous iron transporter B [Rickettsiales bacterium]
MLKIAIAGFGNVGKTSFLNAFCGLNLQVGNFYGTTVDIVEIFTVLKEQKITFFDLPGLRRAFFQNSQNNIYCNNGKNSTNNIGQNIKNNYISNGNLHTYSNNSGGNPDLCHLEKNEVSEEQLTTVNFLNDEDKYNGILHIMDAKNLFNELCLLTELIKLNKPIVIGVNFIEEARWGDVGITCKILQLAFGVHFIPIDLTYKINLDLAVTQLILCCKEKTVPFCVKPSMQNIKHNNVTPNNVLIQNVFTKLVNKNGAIIDLSKPSKLHSTIDKIVMNKYLCLPILFGVLFAMFASIFTLGNPLCALLANSIRFFFTQLAKLLPETITVLGNHRFSTKYIYLMIQGGVSPGVATIVEFLPKILILNMWISVLEISGYTTRIAISLSRFMRKFGLSGQTVFPIVSGLGCTIPGYLSTRIIPNEKERLASMIMVNFVPCHAQLIVCLFFVNIFFKNNAAIVMTILYAVSIFIGLLFAKLYSLYSGYKSSSFNSALPKYRMPKINLILRSSVKCAKEYFYTVFKIIVILSMLIWLLSHIQYGKQTPKYKSAINQMYANLRSSENNPTNWFKSDFDTSTVEQQTPPLTAQPLRINISNNISDKANVINLNTETRQEINDNNNERGHWQGLDSQEFYDKTLYIPNYVNVYNNQYILENSLLGHFVKKFEFLYRFIGFDWKMSLSALTSITAREIALTTIGILYFDHSLQKSQQLDSSITIVNSIKKEISIPSGISYIVTMLLLTPCLTATTVFLKERKGKKLESWIMLFIVNTVNLFIVFLSYTIAKLVF